MDSISRQAAIDADKLLRDIEKYHVSDGKFQHWVQIQQTIKPEQKWIPVSERLPDLDKYSHGEIWKQKVLITGYLSFDSKKELFVSEEFANDVTNGSVNDIVVIAWMPLPRPWRGADIRGKKE